MDELAYRETRNEKPAIARRMKALIRESFNESSMPKPSQGIVRDWSVGNRMMASATWTAEAATATRDVIPRTLFAGKSRAMMPAMAGTPMGSSRL